MARPTDKMRFEFFEKMKLQTEEQKAAFNKLNEEEQKKEIDNTIKYNRELWVAFQISRADKIENPKTINNLKEILKTQIQSLDNVDYFKRQKEIAKLEKEKEKLTKKYEREIKDIDDKISKLKDAAI